MKRSTRIAVLAGTAVAVLVPAAMVSADLLSDGRWGGGPGNGMGNGIGNGNGMGRGNGDGSGTCLDGTATGGTMGGRMGGGMGQRGGAGAGMGARGAGGGVEVLQAQLDTIAPTALSADDEAGLVQMHEEERLAHDVYVALGDRWDVMVFDHIAAAEATHQQAIELLLDRYGIDDPAAGLAAGEFSDPEVQALYDSLVEQGSTSLTEAYRVGATIEELDIADLRDHATDAADVTLVYANLEKGSRNHLRAFARQLDALDASYTPTHLTQSEYDSIVDSDVERGPIG